MKKEQHFNKHEVMSKITPVIENIAAKHNLIPIEISLVNDSNRWFLRIFIYSMTHSITHEDCENITRGLNDYLDEIIPVNYYLEVSSPGTDRKLKSEKEYSIFIGKKAKIKLKKPLNENDGKTIMATLDEYQKGIGLKVIQEGSNQEIMLPTDSISSIKLCVE